MKQDYESLPVLYSTSSCKQSIANRRMVSSECHERHVVRAFSHDGSGAVMTSKQTLELIESIDFDDSSEPMSSAAIAGRHSLLYKHENVVDVDSTEQNAVYSKLLVLFRNLCENTEVM